MTGFRIDFHPAHAPLNGEELRRALTAAWQQTGHDGGKLKLQALRILGEAVTAGRAEIKAAFEANLAGMACASALSDLQDELIRVIYDFTVVHVYRARNPSDAERICVVAQGGYGRGSLAPGSDIDLLFLLPHKQTAWGESVVEYMLYMLWDLGFKVGHAVRSVDDCIRLSAADSTILTAMLEARYIWGDEALFAGLMKRYWTDLAGAKGAAKAFIATKLEERDERHRRAGQSRYLVEPDVKNGKGGMRDLHTLFWIAKFVYGGDGEVDFIRAGVFTGEEQSQFRACEDFLWTVRCHLHFLTGRADDKLSFDKQTDMALRLEYADGGGNRHVELFMRQYFLIAKQVGDLTRIFCSVLEEQHLKRAPRMTDFFRRMPLAPAGGGTVKESADFKFDAGRLNISGANGFARDPVNLIRLFWLANKYNCAIHPDTLKLVTRSLGLIDDSLRTNLDANRLFLDVLTSKRDPEIILRRMNEAGVLGRFIPDFGRIIAHMQFNMYHHYTVDEHLLRAVGVLSEIERGELAEEHPVSHEIIHMLKSRRALFVAIFLHDIAKGRKEDHSIAGARVAAELCPRLGLDPAETETVSWLVRHHLLMSETAQMRDLNDFKAIADFAAIVQSPERLKLLMILSVADIKAVGPGVWNGWKGQLLRTLYFEAEPHLSGGHARVSRAERVEIAHELFRLEVPDWSGKKLSGYLEMHYEPYWLNVPVEQQLRHAKLIDRADRAVMTEVQSDEFTAITELTVYAPDHPRLLALLTGACSAAGANIAGAQIYTTASGHALDTLLIQRELPDTSDEIRRGNRIAKLISSALMGEAHLRDLIKSKPNASMKATAFSVEPQVIIDNDGSNIFTMIEVNGLDRTGLLFELTEELFKLNLNIASAHITTFGEKAVDVFYVTDLTSQKVTNANRRAAIKRHLLAVLSPGRQQASAAPVKTLQPIP